MRESQVALTQSTSIAKRSCAIGAPSPFRSFRPVTRVASSWRGSSLVDVSTVAQILQIGSHLPLSASLGLVALLLVAGSHNHLFQDCSHWGMDVGILLGPRGHPTVASEPCR